METNNNFYRHIAIPDELSDKQIEALKTANIPGVENGQFQSHEFEGGNINQFEFTDNPENLTDKETVKAEIDKIIEENK